MNDYLTSALADNVDRYADRAANWVAHVVRRQSKNLSDYLRTHDGREILSSAKSAIGQRKWLLAGTGVVGGIIAATAIIRANAGSTQSWNQGEFRESYGADVTRGDATAGATEE